MSEGSRSLDEKKGSITSSVPLWARRSIKDLYGLVHALETRYEAQFRDLEQKVEPKLEQSLASTSKSRLVLDTLVPGPPNFPFNTSAVTFYPQVKLAPLGGDRRKTVTFAERVDKKVTIEDGIDCYIPEVVARVARLSQIDSIAVFVPGLSRRPERNSRRQGYGRTVTHCAPWAGAPWSTTEFRSTCATTTSY